MSYISELDRALQELVGGQVTDLGRTVNMAEVGFRREGRIYRLHVQCVFRVVRGEQILIGSIDMNYAEDRKADPAVAYDTYATMYDRNAKRLTALFAATDCRVLSTQVDAAGALTIVASDSFRFEGMPASAGRIEAWRLFEKGSDVHYVYPEELD